MKKIVALVVAIVFALGMASFAFAAEKAALACDKCHKGDKALDKVAAAKKIDSCAALSKAVKEGPKAKLHEKLTDADFKAACDSQKLK
jgi:hypothetical protein